MDYLVSRSDGDSSRIGMTGGPGGGNMGFKHNQYLTYEKDGEDVAMSNLLFTMLNRMDITDTGFSDSQGDLSELYV